MKYNTNLKLLSPSKMSLYQENLLKTKDILLLTYGESDLPVNKEIKSALINSLLDNHDKYTSSYGLLSLRKIIADKINKKYDLNYNYENIIITNGATEALFLSLSSLINDNDEVIIFKPYYPEYLQILNYLHAKINIIDCDNEFNPNIEYFIKIISHKTKLIILNYPNNPSGKILNQETLLILKKYLLKYHTYIVLDNVYDEIIFEKNNTLLQFNELKKQFIIINSLSKSQQLTGWRLGYLICDKEIIDLTYKLKNMINICLPHFLMNAMEISLNLKIELSYYKANMIYAYNYLKKLKLDVFKPQGGFYLIFKIDKFKMSDLEFCTYLADNYQVGLLPCSFFGINNYVRLCFAVDTKKLITSLNRIKKCLKAINK